MKENPDFGLRLAGFLDEEPINNSLGGEILGTVDQASQVVQEQLVDDVVIAMPDESP